MEKQREYEIEPLTDSELEELERNFRRRKSGFYHQVEEQLNKSGLVKVTVPKRTIAGGLWNYFQKQKGYIVKQYKKSDNEIIVIIMTKEKQQELEKKKQMKK